MVPFLASPRKGPHVQMAHYSSIWLCILHKILFPMLNNQYKQYRCYYSSRGSLCRASSRDQASESTSEYFRTASVCDERRPRSSTLRCDSWLNSCQSSHVCAFKVAVQKRFSGSLIKTEGGVLITRRRKKGQQSLAGSKANRIGGQPWPPWKPWDPTLPSQLRDATRRLLCLCIS